MTPQKDLSKASIFTRRKVIAAAAVAALFATQSMPLVAPAHADSGKRLTPSVKEKIADSLIKALRADTERLKKVGADADARGAAADAQTAMADQRTKCWNVLIKAKSSGFQFKGTPDRNDPCSYVRVNGLQVSSLN